jgi:hypothetical protein
VRKFVAGFFPEAELLGVRADSAAVEDEVRRVDVFLRAQAPVSAQGTTLGVPTTPALLPRFGTEERRETPYLQQLGSTTVTIADRLPGGWAPVEELPGALEVDTGCRGVEACWTTSAGRLSALIFHETTRSLIEPVAWVGCLQTMISLQA